MIRSPSGVASAQAGASRPVTNVDLAESLCDVSAQLFEARRVHLRAYGCLLPHVFMGDVLRRIGECLGMPAVRGRAAAKTELRDILDTLERGMVDGDRETRNVIALSFSRDSEMEAFFEKLRPLMGPSTRAQLQGR